MPYDRGTAEPARFALLGLLLAGPSHGYDLARLFAPTSALGDIIHLGASHLYALLARMESEGLIAGEQQEVGSRPQRRVYHLMEAGRDAVLQWIDEPVDHPRGMRIEFPLKLYIARRVDYALSSRLIERQRLVFRDYIARLEQETEPAATPEDAAFMELMRTGRIGRAQVALDWLDACEPVLSGFSTPG